MYLGTSISLQIRLLFMSIVFHNLRICMYQVLLGLQPIPSISSLSFIWFPMLKTSTWPLSNTNFASFYLLHASSDWPSGDWFELPTSQAWHRYNHSGSMTPFASVIICSIYMTTFYIFLFEKIISPPFQCYILIPTSSHHCLHIPQLPIYFHAGWSLFWMCFTIKFIISWKKWSNLRIPFLFQLASNCQTHSFLISKHVLLMTGIGVVVGWNRFWPPVPSPKILLIHTYFLRVLT